MKIIVQIFGVLLTLAAGFGALFIMALGGLSSGTNLFEYLGMLVYALGFFGSPIILGVHCTILRWMNSDNIDRNCVRLMYILVAIATLLLIIFAGQGNYRDIGPYFFAYIISAFICHIGIMVGRK
jgi:hypothetical protein